MPPSAMGRSKRTAKEQHTRERPPFWRRKTFSYLSIVLMVLAALAVYSNTFQSPFHFDDFSSIVWNSAVHNFHNPQAIWSYTPTRFVTYFLFALNYEVHALDVVGYHVLNFLIHLGTGITAWWLILLTFGTPTMAGNVLSRDSRLIALFAALLLLVHPVQTQAVTYIVQRAASLATLCYLLCLALYAKGRLLQIDGRNRLSLALFASSALAGLLAFFSKEIAVTLPAATVLYEFFFFKEKSRSSVIILLTIVGIFVLVFVLSLIYGLFPIPEVKNISRGEYLLTQFRVLATYLRLLVFPSMQNVDYDFPVSTSLFEPETSLSLLVLLLVFGSGAYLFRREKLMSFGIFWFFLALMPESSIVPIEDVIYEHRLYLPMLGYSLTVVVGLYYLFYRRSRQVFILLIPFLIGTYGIAAYARNYVWRDQLALTSDVIAKSPQKPRAYVSRGLIYINRGNYDWALQDLNRAVSLDSTSVEAYLNRGIAFAMKRDLDAALKDFEHALRIDSTDLRIVVNRANVYMEKGELLNAIWDFDRVIAAQPSNALAFTNRGIVYCRLGQYVRGIENFNNALRINPGLIEAYYNRLLAYNKIGRNDLALQDAERMEQLGFTLSPEILRLIGRR